ncbi:hypothetical protein [Brevifollis gellanilyticus]|uniref:Uncharacterized protein n=1 Tax=Brevifollis gellanilyticus TaxID=748831 RepID=A0A512M5R2_9BACT|nr:hypothetical protein [Brevifollis gellanilyticus]GEP42075.1 hypothetical protein BGE01nite_13660 [Brevifollis gellanilyticus]
MKLIESIVVGAMLVLLVPAVAGGIYEIVKQGPSDSFLFGILVFGLPVIIVGLITLPVAIYRAPRVRQVCRLLLVFMIGMVFVIRTLNQRRWSNRPPADLQT